MNSNCLILSILISNEVNINSGPETSFASMQFEDYSEDTTLKSSNFRKPNKGARKNPIEARKTVKGKKAEAKQIQCAAEGITNSRMNLLRALNRVKNDEDENLISRSDEEFSGKSSSVDGMDDRERFQFTKTRKRKSPIGVHSEESSDSDYMKYYPNLFDEPPPKDYYDQIEFLEMFKLITPETLEKLKTRRSERKKRTCTKNQKTDFHYGNFDLNEVSNLIAV